MANKPTKPTKTGTREWSEYSANCVIGCSHDCRYCYARANALRFGIIETPDEWRTMKVREKELRREKKRLPGRIMFPTTHDITPEVIDPCIDYLVSLLAKDNRVLIVSKPHLECIDLIATVLQKFRAQIEFRFSIGSPHNETLAVWEPNAPPFEERLECLKLAAHSFRNFRTSVSAEPLLSPESVDEIYRAVRPYITESFWIGKMNHVRSRCVPGTDETEIAKLERWQTDEAVMGVYRSMDIQSLVRWKDSYRKVIERMK